MTSPKLTVPSSGYGGRGYRDPFTEETYMGLTTALGALEKGAVTQWAVDQTAAYAVANIDGLLNRTEEQGYNMLRWYHKRTPDLDSPDVTDDDLRSAHIGVLDDLSDLGTWVHGFIEADLTWGELPEPWREDQAQMMEAYLIWRSEHDVEPLAVEATLQGDRFMGTADLFAKVDGVPMLIDAKTSRAVREAHIAQLAALGATSTWFREVPEGTEGSAHHKLSKRAREDNGGQTDSWWVQDTPPSFEKYAVLQVRPDDVNSKGEFVPAFCELHEIPQAQIDAAYNLFLAARDARFAQKDLKDAMKDTQ